WAGSPREGPGGPRGHREARPLRAEVDRDGDAPGRLGASVLRRRRRGEGDVSPPPRREAGSGGRVRALVVGLPGRLPRGGGAAQLREGGRAGGDLHEGRRRSRRPEGGRAADRDDARGREADRRLEARDAGLAARRAADVPPQSDVAREEPPTDRLDRREGP